MTERAGQAGGGRLAELETRYQELAARIEDSPTKEAVSVLHGIIHEFQRVNDQSTNGATGSPRESMPVDVANLHRTAPSMAGEAQNEPLPVGSVAPEFTLRDAANREVSLRDFRGKPVVLAFYPLDWSPTCSDQLSLYQSELGAFERFGATVVGISVDSIYSHGAWAAVRGITFPLLADFERKGAVARRYQAYRASDGFSERALYVVDGDGLIRYARIAPRLDHVPDIDELFACLAEITGGSASGPAADASAGHRDLVTAGAGG